MWVGEDRETQRALSVSAQARCSTRPGEFDGAVLVYQDITDLMSALEDQGRLRRVGVPRAADPADRDHGLPRPGARRGGLGQPDGPAAAGRGQAQLRAAAAAGQRPALRGAGAGGAARPRRRAGRTSPALAVAGGRRPRAPCCAGGRGAAPRPAEGRRAGRRPGADPAGRRQPAQQRGEVHPGRRHRRPRGSPTSRRTRSRSSSSDTGIGIDERELARLFTRFFRTQDAEMRAIQGVGLGLAITQVDRRVARRAHRGRVAGRAGQHVPRRAARRPGPRRPRERTRRAQRHDPTPAHS